MSPEQSAEVLTTCMAGVNKWLIQSQLVLNSTMCFSIKRQDVEQNFQINLQDTTIKLIKDFKISKTIQSNLNCFKLIRQYIPKQAAFLYMHAILS